MTEPKKKPKRKAKRRGPNIEEGLRAAHGAAVAILAAYKIIKPLIKKKAVRRKAPPLK